MFKNYLKIASRNLRKQKVYSFINIFGLAVGMACVIFIMLWIQDELSYDRFHGNSKNLYRVVHERHFTEQAVSSAMTPPPLGASLKKDYPEIIHFTRYSKFVGQILLRNDERAFYEKKGAYVDPYFFQMFSFPFVQGDPQAALENKFSIVLSEDMAKKFFGDDDPVGQSLRLESRTLLEVTGIFKDVPHNSHLRFDFLVPFTLLKEWGTDLSNWSGYPQYTYVLLHEKASMQVVNAKIADYLKKIDAENEDKLYLQPLTRIHLHSELAYV